MALNLSMRSLAFIGGITIVGIGALAFDSDLRHRLLGGFFVATTKGVICANAPEPPKPGKLLVDAAGHTDQSAIKEHLKDLEDNRTFENQTGSVRPPIRLVDYRNKKTNADGQFLPVKGACKYTQGDLQAGRIVGKLILTSKNPTTWAVEDQYYLPSPGQYYVLVDYTTTDYHWQMHIVDINGATLFTDDQMVYMSSLRTKPVEDEVFAPDVGYECVEKGLAGCMAKPWALTPKAYGVDKSTQIWVACTLTGCCCSGSGCH